MGLALTGGPGLGLAMMDRLITTHNEATLILHEHDWALMLWRREGGIEGGREELRTLGVTIMMERWIKRGSEIWREGEKGKRKKEIYTDIQGKKERK